MYNKGYYEKNKQAVIERSRAWRKNNRAARLAIERRTKGFPEPTRPMPALCELGCGRPAKCLDHDHKTGAFRGWLCRGCNTALGKLGDSLEGLRRAIAYLEK